jgi:hypothetical protein
MVDFPHFDVPFRWGTNRHAVVVEQDSTEDLITCIQAIIRHEVGSRPEAPEFGINDPTFQAPVDIADIRAKIIRDEPRVAFLLEGPEPDALDELIHRIIMRV